MKIYKFLTMFLSVSFLSSLLLIAKSTKSFAQNLPCNSASVQAISRAYIRYNGFYITLTRGQPVFTNEGFNAWQSGEAKRCGNEIAKLLDLYSRSAYSVERQEKIIESYKRQEALNEVFGRRNTPNPTPYVDLTAYLKAFSSIIQGISIANEQVALGREFSRLRFSNEFIQNTQLNEIAKQIMLLLEQQGFITPEFTQLLLEMVLADVSMIMQLGDTANEITRQQQ